MLFKTPTATLAVGLLALALLLRPAWCRRLWTDPERRWALLCLFVPLLVLGLWSVTTKVTNAGVRYVLPLYPFLLVALGVAVARAWWKGVVWIRALLVTLAVALAAESLTAFPDYLSFFNALAGGSRGGIRLLGDANLDLGQDLPALAEWQRRHPGTKLYLSYFGTADPASYGIEYTNIPPGYRYGPQTQWPSEPGVIAVSASTLQGTRLNPRLRQVWRRFASREPLEVLGGTIYLFDFEPEATGGGAFAPAPNAP
jgi:hypothetical protein